MNRPTSTPPTPPATIADVAHGASSAAEQLAQQQGAAEQRLDAARARVLRLRGQLEEAEQAQHQALIEWARLGGAGDMAHQLAGALQNAINTTPE